MTNAEGLDRAVEYVQKLETFRTMLRAQDVGCTKNGDTVEIEVGRKFDKVYFKTGTQNRGRYMVDRNSWIIYGIKSWQQINPRRIFGTLDTIDQYNWSQYYGVPKAGTAAEKEHTAREATITANYRTRGRPRKLSIPQKAGV
jgi:hypothetical protein